MGYGGAIQGLYIVSMRESFDQLAANGFPVARSW